MSTRTLTQETLRRLSGDRHHRGSSRAKIVPAPRVGCACIQYCTSATLLFAYRICRRGKRDLAASPDLTPPESSTSQIIETPKEDSSWLLAGSWLALGSSHLLCSCPFPPSHTLCLSFLCLYPPYGKTSYSLCRINVSRSHHLHLFE